MRLVIVGEAPSQHSDPKFPFKGASGDRLAQLAGLSGYDELAAVADLKNVLDRWPGPGHRGEKGSAFPAIEARRAASKLWEHIYYEDGIRKEPSLVLLCGKRVARAFRIEFDDYFQTKRPGWETQFALFPHPSGCNRWFNYLKNRVKAGMFLQRAIMPATSNAAWLRASMREPGPLYGLWKKVA